MLHTQCAEAEAAIKDPRFDPKLIHSAWSAWGHTLLQLATVQQTMEHKLEYLSRSREKLQKAISLNDNTIAPDEKFTYFVVRSSSLPLPALCLGTRYSPVLSPWNDGGTRVRGDGGDAVHAVRPCRGCDQGAADRSEELPSCVETSL